MLQNKPRLTVFAAGLSIAVLWGVWLLGGAGTGSHYVLSDPDAYLHLWNLWWVAQSLGDFTSPYATQFIGYPDTISLTYHQLIFPLGLLSTPLFFLGLHAGQVFLIWQYLFLFAGFLGMYGLALRWTGRSLASCLAGLYYVFTPIFWENLPRPDSLAYVVFPWFVRSLYWSQQQPRRRVVVPSLLGAFLVLMSPYYAVGWLLIGVISLFFVTDLSLDGYHLATVAALSLLFSSFEWIPQALGEGPNVVVDRAVVEAFSADLTAWFLPHPRFVWWPDSYAWWTDYWTAGIHSSIYLGWTAVFIGLLGFGRLKKGQKQWTMLVTAIMFVISLGPGIRFLGTTYGSGLLPYGWALAMTDSVKAFRIPLRFGYFIVFLVGLGIAYGLPKKRAITLLIGGLMLVELIRVPMQVRPLPDVQNLKTVRNMVDEPALVPVPFTDWATEVQFGQTIHKKKFHLAGLSYVPKNVWDQVSRNPFLDALYQDRPLPDDGLAQLGRQGVGGVIVHYRILRETRRRQLTRQLENHLGPPVYRTERFKLYRLGP